MRKRILSKKSIPFWFAILLFVVFYLLSISFSQEQIRGFITKFGPFGPFILIILILLTHIIAPLSGSPFFFVGFLIFGKITIIYITLATIFSSIINFWIARKWGRQIAEKFLGKHNMSKIDRLSENYGLGMMFILRIFQGGIDDLISYAAGLTDMKFIPYFIVSTLGMIPGSILWYYLSSYITTPLEFIFLTWGMLFIFSGIFLISSILIKKIKT